MKLKNKDEVNYFYYRCDYILYPHLYSPLYNKSFKDMTEQEIKHQLDVWIEDGLHSEIFEMVEVSKWN